MFALVAQGRDIFRFDTFGDESFWTDTLRLHEVIQSGVDPTTALSVGLKVDTDSLPPAVVQGIQNGTISLKSPATTVALLKLNAVVGVRGTVQTVSGKDTLTRVGITCALCHSTVDNSFARGIGKRLDGWPNRDTSTLARSSRSPQCRRRAPGRSTARGERGSTTPGSTSMGRTGRRSSRRPTAFSGSAGSPPPAMAATSRTGIATSA